MIKEIASTLIQSARASIRNWRVLAVCGALYAMLLAAVYLFATTKEARLWQVAFTFSLAIAAPVLFFLLQSLVVTGSIEEPLLKVLSRSLNVSWKLFLVSIPLVIVALMSIYAISRLHPAKPVKPERTFTVWGQPDFSPAIGAVATRNEPPPRVPKRDVLYGTLRLLLLGMILPLLAIHLWIAAAREGLRQTFVKTRQILAKAMAPNSISTYMLGLMIFLVIPYLLLFTRTPAQSARMEFGLLNFRLFLVFALTLLGWIVTVGALRESNIRDSIESVPAR